MELQDLWGNVTVSEDTIIQSGARPMTQLTADPK